MKKNNALENIDKDITDVNQPESLNGYHLPCERGIIDTLQQKLAERRYKTQEEHAKGIYKELYTEFLAKSNTIIYRDEKIRLPRFGVYSLGYPSMYITLYKSRGPVDLSFIGCFMNIFRGPEGSELDQEFCAEILQSVNSVPRYPAVFTKYLLKSLDLFQNNEPRIPKSRTREGTFFALGSDLSKETRQKYMKLTRDKYRNINDIKFNTHLNTLVPSRTKTKIDEATHSCFTQDDIYFIAEVKPEEWNVTVIKSDPLVVGVKGEHCFLIDQFDATSLEKYLTYEYTSGLKK